MVGHREEQDTNRRGNLDFFVFDRAIIHQVTTPAYRQFLRESGYGDLDSCSRIEIAKGVLKYDRSVRDAGTRAGLNLTGANGQYVVNINHPNARKLVEALGYKLPTVGLMYRVCIPYIKELVQQGNAEAQATLSEMINAKAEWLEDLVKGRKKVCVGTKEKRVSLPGKDGSFDRQDINECGYPTSVKAAGEFYYWHVSGDERAAFRGWSPELCLSLDGRPSFEGDGLGVRLAKILQGVAKK